MVLKTISESLDVLNKSADFIKKLQEIEMNFTLPDEVKKINAKLDQDITRKIRSGYESIKFALGKSSDSNSRNQDLEDARNDLRQCVNLSDELDTEGIPNGDVMATAHYGLAIVYNMRGDNDRTGYHLLKAFEAGPRKTRELVPEIYNQLFKSQCGNLVTTLFSEEIQNISPETRRRLGISQVVVDTTKEHEALAKKQDDCCKKAASEYLAKFPFK